MACKSCMPTHMSESVTMYVKCRCVCHSILRAD